MAQPEEPTVSPAPDGAPAPEERPMTFLDHLEELRWTLVKSVIAFTIAFTITAVFFAETKDLLSWPLRHGTQDYPDVIRQATNTPLGIFSVLMTICLIGAVTMSLPFVLIFLCQFVAPALTPKERRLLVPAAFLGVVLFLSGAAFSFFFLVPSVIRVSAYMNALLEYEAIWTPDRYFSMLLWMVLGMGAAFQFPLVIQVLVYLELVTVRKLRSLRRVALFVCFVAAAFITPTPDPINMAIVAVPLYILYELSIWVATAYTLGKVAERNAELGG